MSEIVSLTLMGQILTTVSQNSTAIFRNWVTQNRNSYTTPF